MTSLLSKLFGTATPRVRRSTRRARLGVENLDGRIMPMTMVELQVIVGAHAAPRPAKPPGARMPPGGKAEVLTLGQGAGHAHPVGGTANIMHAPVSTLGRDAGHAHGWII